MNGALLPWADCVWLKEREGLDVNGGCVERGSTLSVCRDQLRWVLTVIVKEGGAGTDY